MSNQYPHPAPTPLGTRTATEFVQQALSRVGTPYQWGAESKPDDPKPRAFDCSELVYWAAARAGVRVPGWSEGLWGHVTGNCCKCTVAEAVRTPGALLFGDRHVAISLGDGDTVEAVGGPVRRVIIGRANAQWITHAGLVPVLVYNQPDNDPAGDGSSVRA